MPPSGQVVFSIVEEPVANRHSVSCPRIRLVLTESLAYLTKEFDPAAGISLINLQLLFLMEIDRNACVDCASLGGLRPNGAKKSVRAPNLLDR